MTARSMVAALGCGVLFGGGLAVSGLTRPEVVLGFLDVMGRWDPTLGLVMVTAATVNAVAIAIATWRGRPLWTPRFNLPRPGRIDRRLLAGSVVFGVGWGLVGVCPGPALTSLAFGDGSVLTFVVSMTTGLVLVDAVARGARRLNKERVVS